VSPVKNFVDSRVVEFNGLIVAQVKAFHHIVELVPILSEEELCLVLTLRVEDAEDELWWDPDFLFAAEPLVSD
jgi:hypothetical protein